MSGEIEEKVADQVLHCGRQSRGKNWKSSRESSKNVSHPEHVFLGLEPKAA